MVLRRFLVVVVLLLATGCAAGDGADDTAIEVDPAVALVDQPVDIRVTGLDAGRRVEVELTGPDVDGVTWRSSGTWMADAQGVVDLGEDAPLEGSYDGVDGMGLFWSMTPADGGPGASVSEFDTSFTAVAGHRSHPRAGVSDGYGEAGSDRGAGRGPVQERGRP